MLSFIVLNGGGFPQGIDQLKRQHSTHLQSALKQPG